MFNPGDREKDLCTTSISQIIRRTVKEVVHLGDETIFVGSKPVMNYVMAIMTKFGEGLNEVVLKARGKAISRAVDVAELIRRRVYPGVRVKKIDIDTEEIQDENGRDINVSAIEIVLSNQ